MIIVVDGYNLLKQIHEGGFITDGQRLAFIQQLNAYGKRKKHGLVVVFDGGPSHWIATEKVGVVTVVYSGQDSADDYIKQHCKDKKGKEVVVISQDRELVNFVESHNHIAIKPLVFYSYVMHKKEEQSLYVSGDTLYKLNDSDDDELDQLMEESTRTIVQKKGEDVKKQKTGDRISKKEKKIVRILNKL